MNTIKYTLILSSFLLNFSTAYACGKTPLISTEKNGIKYGLFIKTEQIIKTPKWAPESGEPPLSVSSAYNIAKTKSIKFFARYDSVNVRSISLNQYICDTLNGYWYYKFDISPVIDGNELSGAGNWVAVLMDGSLIGTKKY